MSTIDTTALFNQCIEAIAEIDAHLDAAEGSNTSGTRAFRSALVAEHGPLFETAANSISEKLTPLSDAQLTAALSVFNKVLNSFNERVTAFVEANVPKVEATDKPDDEELTKLFNSRNELIKKASQCVSFAKAFGEDTEAMVVPRRRNRSIGKRGKQILSTFSYEIFDEDGNEVELDEDVSLNDIAKKYGYENGREIRSLFKSSAVWYNIEGEPVVGIDNSNPPDKFNLTLKNGFELVGSRPVIVSNED